MKLITPSEFKDLQDNDDHFYDVDKNTFKEVLKIYDPNERLIAKRIIMSNKKKRSTRYFGVEGYQEHLSDAYKKSKEPKEEKH